MKRGIPRKGMNPALAALSRRHEENNLIRAAAKANQVLTLMVLHDKFDFDEDDCEKFFG